MRPTPALPPATRKLGVMLPGLGAVATTFVAGVEAVRRGLAQPFGSLTQMQTVRLGARTEGRTPLIKDVVDLASLDDLVFAAWDPIPDNAFDSASRAGVLDSEHLGAIRDYLSEIEPMPAVFDTAYVKKLDGPNVKTGVNKRDLAEQLRADIRTFKARSGADRLVMIWCGSTEIFLRAGPTHGTLESFEAAMEANDDSIAPRHALRLCGPDGGSALCQRRSESLHRCPGPRAARRGARSTGRRGRTSRPGRRS